MLSERSKQIRRDTIRLSKENGGYHYGGSFSCVEILITLFDCVLKLEDKFILSKGHACWPYYVLLREKGYNPKLEGHPTRDEQNGVHCSTGSMGHGLPTGIGMAMAKKLKGESGKIYVLMGDGECQEGTTWESLLIAGKYKLDNLLVIVDSNQIQGSGFVKDILPVNLYDIVGYLDWQFTNINGHDFVDLKKALSINYTQRPKLILAQTVKGKGVSFMENSPKWHSNWLAGEEEKQAMKELRPTYSLDEKIKDVERHEALVNV